MKRYVVSLTITACITLSALTALNIVGTLKGWGDTWNFSPLLTYQIEKLEKTDELDVVLVGDSSLGNAIDARQWQTALQRNVTSLALTGDFSYGGSFAMIARAIKRHTPRKVLIFHTLDNATLPVAHSGVFFAAEGWQTLRAVPFLPLLKTAFSLDVTHHILLQLATDNVSTFKRDYTANRDTIAALDYFPQRERKDASIYKSSHALMAANIPPDRGFYLRKISALCKRHKIDCLYVHGPLIDYVCGPSAPYVSHLSALVRRTGVDVATNTPICLAPHQMGDAWDHVALEHRADISEVYLTRLRDWLDD